MEVTKLSVQGQVIIPQSLREAHHWNVGQRYIDNIVKCFLTNRKGCKGCKECKERI